MLDEAHAKLSHTVPPALLRDFGLGKHSGFVPVRRGRGEHTHGSALKSEKINPFSLPDSIDHNNVAVFFASCRVQSSKRSQSEPLLDGSCGTTLDMTNVLSRAFWLTLCAPVVWE